VKQECIGNIGKAKIKLKKVLDRDHTIYEIEGVAKDHIRRILLKYGMTQWIDEFNRATMNKAFGEMFLAIEYHEIKLPPSEARVYHRPTIEIPESFRMICTMNDFDKNLLLTELSYRLM
jgi:hypothetical protein